MAIPTRHSNPLNLIAGQRTFLVTSATWGRRRMRTLYEYRAQGRYEQVEPLMQRALAIRETILGPEHPEVAERLHDLARLYTDQGRYSDAEPLYQRALAICEQQLGPEHPYTVTIREAYRAFVKDMQQKGTEQP